MSWLGTPSIRYMLAEQILLDTICTPNLVEVIDSTKVEASVTTETSLLTIAMSNIVDN